MKRIFSKLLVILLGIGISATAYASWSPIIRHFTPKNYGAGTQNWDMAEQANGWMYVANNYGLLETDGCHWNLYGISNSTALRAITIDKDGNIYVGGTDEFGVFSGDSLGGLRYQALSTHIPERYRKFGEVWRLQIADDKLYVQTRHYIFVYTEENIEVLDPGAIIYESLVWEGNLYVATSRDIFVQSGGRLHALRGAEALHNSVVCGLLPYGSEGMLIATDLHGLYLYDGESIHRFYTEADSYITKNQLYNIALSQNKMALGTVQGGVVLADLDGKHCEYITREEGLQNNTILSLLFDSQLSTDGVQYTTVYTATNAKGGIQDIVLPIGPTNARYVRILCHQRNTGYGSSLWEVEVYGVKVPTSLQQPSTQPTTTMYMLHHGQIYIIHNGVKYDATGRSIQ